MILAGALPKVKRFFRHACLSLATVGLLARPSRDEKPRSGWRLQRRFGLALGGTRGPVARQGRLDGGVATLASRTTICRLLRRALPPENRPPEKKRCRRIAESATAQLQRPGPDIPTRFERNTITNWGGEEARQQITASRCHPQSR